MSTLFVLLFVLLFYAVTPLVVLPPKPSKAVTSGLNLLRRDVVARSVARFRLLQLVRVASACAFATGIASLAYFSH